MSVQLCPPPKRVGGRPRMSTSIKLRARNRRWLLEVLRGEATILELALLAEMSERQVRRGIADAASYPEISESVRSLAQARGLAHAG